MDVSGKHNGYSAEISNKSVKSSVFIAMDKRLSERLAICSSVKSSYGHFRPLMRLLEYSGHGVAWFAGSIALIFLSHQLEMQEKLINLLVALCVDLLVVGLVKLAFRRQRPSYNVDDMMVILVDCYSFPSGHTTRAVMLTCFIIRNFDVGVYVKALLITWAVLVSVSRVLLGRHHVSDVLCGAVIGLFIYVAIATIIWFPANTCTTILQSFVHDVPDITFG